MKAHNEVMEYPYLVAVYCCESDMCVQPVTADAESIASLILTVGCNSSVAFYSPAGEEVVASDYDNGIERCSDETFLRGLLSVFDEMKNSGAISEAYCKEPEIDADEWQAQCDRYYEPPYIAHDGQQMM